MRFVVANYLKSTLVKDTFVYTLTDAVGKAIGFLLLPIVSYSMSPEELGMATNFSVLSSIVSLLGGLAVINSLPYFFYERTKDENTVLISNMMILCFFACIILLVLCLFFNSMIYDNLKLSAFFQVLAVVNVFFSFINTASLLLLRLEDKAKDFALYQLSNVVIHCLLVVVLVIFLKTGGVGKIYSDVFTALLISFVHIKRLVKMGYIKLIIEKSVMKMLVKFGLPLLPHSLSFWLKSGADKVFITNNVGLYENGLYSMSLTINSIYSMLSNAFFQAYTPYLNKKLANLTPQTERIEKVKIVKLSYLLIFIFAVVALLTCFAGYFILEYIVDAKYQKSFVFVPYLIAGLWIYNIYQFSIQFIYKQKKTFIMGIITFSGALIQMLLSYFMIQHYGTIGAAYSTIIGSLIISIGIFIYSNKVYPMPWMSFRKVI